MSSSGSEWVGTLYTVITWLLGIATFLGSWIYCMSEYGYLLGFGLGWLPSIIAAGLVALLWPLALLAGLVLLALVMKR